MSNNFPKLAKLVIGPLLKTSRQRPNLSHVTQINIQFCPWETNSVSTKELWIKLNGDKCRRTNRMCRFKTEVLHDGSEPMTTVTFADGEKLCLHGANLKCDEMLYHFNSFCIDKKNSAKDAPEALF